MTLKDIAKQLTTAVQTVPNLVQILRDGLEQATAGSTVEVTQVVSSGTKIASVKVDSATTDLYAPSAEEVYSTTGTKIGKYGTADLYRIVVPFEDVSIQSGQSATIATLATGLNVLCAYGMAYDTGVGYAIPEKELRATYNTSNGDLKLSSSGSWSNSYGTVIVLYTIPAA